jgi:hypothetical protein
MPSSSGLMTPNDPVVIKSSYLKPIEPDPELQKESVNTKYAILMRSRKCTTCNNLATQMACYDVDGAILTRKYCDDCIKQNKHVEEKI